MWDSQPKQAIRGLLQCVSVLSKYQHLGGMLLDPGSAGREPAARCTSIW